MPDINVLENYLIFQRIIYNVGKLLLILLRVEELLLIYAWFYSSTWYMILMCENQC